MEEYRRRSKEAAKAIRALLEPSAGEADQSGAYAILKRWYQNVSTRVTNAYQTDMEKVRGYFQNLHQRENPHTLGLSLATHVDPAQVNSTNPSESEVEAEVRRLLLLKEVEHTHLRTDHFKQWLREV